MIHPERIQERMKALNINAAALAREIGVSAQAVSKMLKGDTSDPRRLPRIARALLTSVAYLEAETDDPSISAAELSFDQQDLELLELIRALDPDSRDAVVRIVRIMAHSARVPGVQSPKSKFTGPSEAQLHIKPGVRA